MPGASASSDVLSTSSPWGVDPWGAPGGRAAVTMLTGLGTQPWLERQGAHEGAGRADWGLHGTSVFHLLYLGLHLNTCASSGRTAFKGHWGAEGSEGAPTAPVNRGSQAGLLCCQMLAPLSAGR